MRNVIKLEELGQFLFSVYLFLNTDYAWWVFPVLLFTPDIAILGYLGSTKLGAFLYNIAHHKLIAMCLLIFGYYTEGAPFILCGIILFAHSSFDRIWGFGLKYPDNFKHTHLGWIG